MSKLNAAIFVILFAAFAMKAQTEPTAAPSPPNLDSIISRADIQAQMYRETFKDLIADEKKTFVEFDKNGAEKKSTVVESDFLVYQTSKAGGDITELRNVLRVDGKTVPDAFARADRLQAELQKTDTAAAELEKIANESLRFDKTYEVDGLTLYEGIVLTDYLRPFFEFQMLGTESLDGAEVFVIGFRQTKPSPYITFNGKGGKTDKIGLEYTLNLPGAVKKENVFLRGKYYIDAATFQIRREIREAAVQNANPVPVLTTVFDYTASEYEILVPKKIVLTANKLKKNSNKQFDAVKEMEINFDYSRFRKSDVDVQILDEEEEKQP